MSSMLAWATQRGSVKGRERERGAGMLCIFASWASHYMHKYIEEKTSVFASCYQDCLTLSMITGN